MIIMCGSAKNGKRCIEDAGGKEKPAGRIWDKDNAFHPLSVDLFENVSFLEKQSMKRKYKRKRNGGMGLC